jgi:hypothetical protein
MEAQDLSAWQSMLTIDQTDGLENHCGVEVRGEMGQSHLFAGAIFFNSGLRR